MASAEQIYVDPSALRSLYLHDDRSARFCAWRKRVRGPLPLTRFGRGELVNSIQLAVHRKLIDSNDALGALAELDLDIEEGRFTLLDALWRRTLDLASDLSLRHSAKLGTRTLDVLHVATALMFGNKHFVTYDERQRALAKACGLRVTVP